MCIHHFNVHTCGHLTPNLDHTLNHHCTNVQSQLSKYHGQPRILRRTNKDARNPRPGSEGWPMKPPSLCPAIWPTPPHAAPSRDLDRPIQEDRITGWTTHTEDAIDHVLRTNDANFPHVRQFANSMAHPTIGDGLPNVVLIRVPWGCGLDMGPCANGLAGKRCMNKELPRARLCPRDEWERERRMIYRFRTHGISDSDHFITQVLSDGEIAAALEEERRIRHIEDVRALEMGFDPARPLDDSDEDDLEDNYRMASRKILWESLDTKTTKRPMSQIWGAAMMIGFLDPQDENLHPKNKKRRHKDEYMLRSSRTNSSLEGLPSQAINTSRQASSSLGHPAHHDAIASNANSNARLLPAPGNGENTRGDTSNTLAIFSQNQNGQGSSSDQAAGASNNSQNSRDINITPRTEASLTGQDTDRATIMTYGHPFPLHTGCGRPIIDGSLEYWEAREVVDERQAAPTFSYSCPTIITESGELILIGNTENIEVMKDEVVGLMSSQSRWGTLSSSLVHGRMEVGFGEDDNGKKVEVTTVWYYEKPRDGVL